MNNITDLSNEFSRLVQSYLSIDELKLICEKNATPDYAGCCATHDYCDANMIMDEAFQNIVGKEFSLQSLEDINLWNEAWTLSKQSNFHITETNGLS